MKRLPTGPADDALRQTLGPRLTRPRSCVRVAEAVDLRGINP
jgi:hypothetical protein